MAEHTVRRNSRLCQWEAEGFCCYDGGPMGDGCFSLSGDCCCKTMPHDAHYRSFDGQVHPNDRTSPVLPLEGEK